MVCISQDCMHIHTHRYLTSFIMKIFLTQDKIKLLKRSLVYDTKGVVESLNAMQVSYA